MPRLAIKGPDNLRLAIAPHYYYCCYYYYYYYYDYCYYYYVRCIPLYGSDLSRQVSVDKLLLQSAEGCTPCTCVD